MKKIISIILTAGLLASCMGVDSILKGDSGTFRGRWYNYYDRGINYSVKSSWEDAEHDLKRAIGKRSKDQRMARTYGMHFIDYFPHREIGIVYFYTDRIDQAIKELEESLSNEESAKASYYLNKARKAFLLKQEGVIYPPEIIIDSPHEGAALSSFSVNVTGKVSGEGYVAKIFVNERPYRFDLARKTVSFEKDVTVDEGTDRIVIMTEDLLGNVSKKTLSLVVDRDGPTINIFDLMPEKAGGKDIVRVTGEVNDSTGIRKLFINGETIRVNNAKNYEFNVVVERGPRSRKFTVRAFDGLDNRTVAELDIEKELSAFHEKQEPVLLASAIGGLFSSDDKPPVITLKDSVDIPAVFVDKYYVEGEVSDNKRVEKILINGRTVLAKRGRKIFFSKVVKLDEGKNEIDVEAWDSSGNRAEADFSVTRNIPEVMQVGSRMSISILPFNTKNQGTATDLLAYDHLTGSFVEQKRFNIIERAELERVLLEQKLTREKLTDPKYSIKVGRLMAADTILATALIDDLKSIEFTARVINTETSEVMEVKDVFSEDRSSASIKQLMEGLASKVAGSFPLVEGIIIKKDNRIIYMDLGSQTRVKRDMGVIVYRRGEEIRHPLTGKSLGWDVENLGEGNIEEVHEKLSKAKLSDKSAPGKVTVMDMVITK